MRDRRKMWQSPWGYAESGAVTGGIMMIGIILQLVVGCFDFYLLVAPSNLLAGGMLIFLPVLLGGLGRRRHFVQWLSGVPMCVTIILALLILAIIMGLTPQATDGSEGKWMLGLDTMTRAWPFVLVYLLVLLSLGTLIVRRLFHFHIRDCAFYLNHVGLWLLLFAAGLGYADTERYIMYVGEGQTEWRVYDDVKNVKELPIAIQLNDFNVEVYPPKLAVIDRNSGEVQPLGQAQYFQIDPDMSHGRLYGWEIEVDEYIHQAVRNSDSTYRAVLMPGATPAAYVTATKEGMKRKGWVCGGNQAQLYMSLPLSEQYCMVMTAAEPRKFTSDIVVYAQHGEIKKTVLEVNKPARIGSWTIYQYGYDNQAGQFSSYSSFELVYDPWLIPVYGGILCMMLGSMMMIWTRRRKEVQV